MIARMVENWKSVAFWALMAGVLIVEPAWAFAAVRYFSAMIYALLLALSS